MKSKFSKGDFVTTNRKYKKRFGGIIEGMVIGNTHFDRFVNIKDDNGVVHSIKPEFLEQMET